MTSMEELASLTQMGVKAALQAGADQAEAYGDASRRIHVDISGKHIHHVRVIYDSGIGIRSYVKGGMGFSYNMQLSKKAIKDAARKATELAKVAQRDPYFKSLAERKKPKRVERLFDEELATMRVEEASHLVESMIGAALETSKEAVLRGNLIVVSRKYVIVNSLGIDFGEPTTSIFTGLMCIIKRTPENVGSGMEFDEARNLKGLKPEWVAQQAVDKSLKFLGAVQSKTRTCTLLLSPNATLRFAYAMGTPLDGENVALDRSCLADKIETKVASEKLTIVDDGVIDGGIDSSSVDAEGVPKQRFAVIENGILKTYFHNSYTADRMGMENNACAARASYRSSVRTAPSNLQIKPGDQSLDEIISDVKDGIYVDSFPWMDPVTGNISAMIDFGTQIRNGELAEPVKGTMIGSNILSVLMNIDAVSKETRCTSGVIMPYLRVRDVQIAGK